MTDNNKIIYCQVCGVWHEPGFLAYIDHAERFHKIELIIDAAKSLKEMYIDTVNSVLNFKHKNAELCQMK